MAKKKMKKKGAMISEDYSKLANLPQQVVMKDYPTAPYPADPYLNDTIGGIDEQMYYDTKKASGYKKEKY